MIYTLKNDFLTVDVSNAGAELQSIRSSRTGREFLWQGDSKYWGERAPILFPVCGRLTDGTYTYGGKTYHMGLHGFARHADYTVEQPNEKTLCLTLVQTPEMAESYPFSYSFVITYTLDGARVRESVEVRNLSETSELPFCFGGHPGFCVPMAERERFEDYYLEFSADASPLRMDINEKGFPTGKSEPYALKDGKVIELDRHFFDSDGIFLKNAASTVSLKSKKSFTALSVHYHDMTYIGFWQPAHTDAPFLCIEPWHGFPSQSGVVEDFAEKKDMIHLAPSDTYMTHFDITVME